MDFVRKLADRVSGVLSGFDRLLVIRAEDTRTQCASLRTQGLGDLPLVRYNARLQFTSRKVG